MTAGSSPLDDRVAEIALLVGSPHRVRILLALYERDGCTRDELRELVDASRTTVHRNVDALEDHGWITTSAVEYAITPAGALVTEELRDLVETVGLAAELRDVLRWLPREELGFDLRALSDARITVGTPTDPYAPIRRLADRLTTASAVRGLFPAASPATVDAVHSRATDGVDWSIVLGAAVREALESNPAYASRFEDLQAAEELDLYAVTGSVPFYLGLVDGEVQLGIVNGDAVMKALVESEAPAVEAWADEVFADYRARATPVE